MNRFLKFFSSTIFIHISNLLLVMAIINILTLSQLGVYAVINSVLRVVGPYINLSMPYAILISRNKTVAENRYRYSSGISIITSIIMVAVLLSVFLAVYRYEYARIIIVMVLLSWSKGASEFKRSYLRSVELFNRYSILNMLLSLGMIIGACFIYVTENIFWAFVPIIIMLYQSDLDKIKFNYRRQYRRYAALISRKTIYVAFNSSVAYLLYASDVFIMKYFSAEPELIGEFYIYSFFPTNLLIVSSVVGAYIFNRFKVDRLREIKTLSHLFVTNLVVFLFLFLVSLFLIYFSELIFKVFFNKNIITDVYLLSSLCALMLLNSCGRMFFANFLVANGAVRRVFYNTAITAVINIISSFFLYIYFGMYGLVLGSFFAVCYSTIDYFLRGRSLWKNS